MVLIAAASDDHHQIHHRRSHRAAKPSPTTPKLKPKPEPLSPPRLDCFSFTWGARRLLRFCKDGAPATPAPTPSPPHNPHTPPPNKEKPPQGHDAAAAGSSSRPQRSRSLRPLRYAAAHPAARSSDGALHTPASAPPPPPPLTEPRKRGFDVVLSKQEVARDLAAAGLKRQPRRGKKRSKVHQNKIDMLCPGLILLDPDNYNYKIDEK